MSDQPNTAEQIMQAVGTQILDTLQKGQEVLNSDGEPVRIKPSAAYISAALKYCAMHGRKPGDEQGHSMLDEIKDIMASTKPAAVDIEHVASSGEGDE